MDGPLYVYGVVPSSACDLISDQPGIADAPVGIVGSGSIGALVSEAPAGRVRPTRANLKAHEDVVCAAHAVSSVLPLRFGTVMPDSGTVREKLLEPNAPQFLGALEELAGKDEFRVRARYRPEVSLREVLERNHALRNLRDRMAGSSKVAVGDRIHLGEMVFAELQRLREADSSALLDSVAQHIVAWRPLDDPSEDVAAYIACLVARQRRADWDSALSSLARKEGDRLGFEVIGPLPAWDFSEMHLEAA